MTFWMVRDSGMDDRISRDWMLLMILFLIRYFALVLMFVLAVVPPYEAFDEDAEVNERTR